MYGPLPKVPGNAVLAKDEEKSMSNQIWDYLIGPQQNSDASAKPANESDNEQEHEKINSRDAKLHFLMARYTS